ncbi:hypothetical protein Bpfe_031038 [Biomphalaria pfeifferi]|uniref:Uncharacterized protein n=1 Tax=Biomphalaria pfeifferi TaxID=112525 RepID=A0AAD8ANS9_BIOPF|nr:hypothetical protein Bpfe_031038 [Biomphalaria pfeifferi]
MPGVPQIPEFKAVADFAQEMRTATVDAFNEGIRASELFFKNLERNGKRLDDVRDRNLKLAREYVSRVDTREVNYDLLTERNRKLAAEQKTRTYDPHGTSEVQKPDKNPVVKKADFQTAGLDAFASDSHDGTVSIGT